MVTVAPLSVQRERSAKYDGAALRRSTTVSVSPSAIAGTVRRSCPPPPLKPKLKL